MTVLRGRELNEKQARNPLFVVGLSLVFAWTHTLTGVLRLNAGLAWVAGFFASLALFMVVLVFADKRDAKRRSTLFPTGYIAAICFVLASLLLIDFDALSFVPRAAQLVALCLAGGYSIAHTYRSWSTPFSEMPAFNACTMVTFALVLSVLIEFVCRLAPHAATCTILALMGAVTPVILNACYAKLDGPALTAEQPSRTFMENARAAVPLWRMAVGITVFSFAMGVSWTLLLSNPNMDMPTVDYLTYVVVLVGVFLLWAVCIKVIQRVSFRLIWICIVMLVSAAILVAPQVDGLAYEFATSFVRAAQSMMVVLWFLALTDVARKNHIDASHVVSMGWLFYALPVACGMVFGMLLAPIDPLHTLLPSLTVLALVVVAFIVDDSDLEQDLFYREGVELPSASAAMEHVAADSDAQGELSCDDEAVAAEDGNAEEPVSEAEAPAPRKTRTYTADPERRETETVIPDYKRYDDGMGSGRRDKLSVRCVAIARDYNLTNREFDVLVRLAHGRSGTYIAQELTLSENTVKGHSKRLYAKLGVHSRQELINMAESYDLKD